MSSSHSALMSALTVSMWLFYGWKSPWFAVAFVSSIVAMYDATGVRLRAGEQAMILDDLIRQVQEAGIAVSDTVSTTLRHWKRTGHAPKEVIGRRPVLVLGYLIFAAIYLGFGMAMRTFNAFTGIAALPASILAGFLWQVLGLMAKFGVGSVCAALAAALLVIFRI